MKAGGVNQESFSGYLDGVREKRVAIKETKFGLYPASFVLDAVFPNGGSLTRQLEYPEVRRGSISRKW